MWFSGSVPYLNSEGFDSVVPALRSSDQNYKSYSIRIPSRRLPLRSFLHRQVLPWCFHTRFSNGLYCLDDKISSSTCVRPASMDIITTMSNNPPKSILRFGLQNFSSTGPTPQMVLTMPALSPTLSHGTSDLPPHVVLEMPALSPTMNQGNIAKWCKKEGDKIEVGDVIGEIETDKATLEFDSLEEGYLAKIQVPEGSKDVAVGKPIALIVEDAESIEAIKSSSAGGSEVETEKQPPQSVVDRSRGKKAGFTKISPAAKLLILEHGLEASSIEASGPYGTLLKSDVVAAIASGKTAKRSVSTEKKQPSKDNVSKSSSISRPESKSSATLSDDY